MSSILKVDTIQDQAGNNIISEAANVITIGASGDTITVPAGATVSGFTSAGIDDNATSVAMTIDSSERVGLNTTSPGAKLEIQTSTDWGNIINSTNSGTQYLQQFEYNGSSIGKIRGDNSSIAIESGSNLILQTANTERMRINSSGSVGIGTSSPGTVPLSVVSTDGGNVDDILEIRNNSTTSGTGARLRFVSSTDPSSVPNSVSISSYRNTGSDHDMLFESSGSEKMRIRSTGLVGINTSSPSQTLDVNGVISSSSELRLVNAYTKVADADAQGGFAGGYNINVSTNAVQHSVNGSAYGIHYSSSALTFNTNGSASGGTAVPERMRITSAGNVGIGTSAPQANTEIVGGTGDIKVLRLRTGDSTAANNSGIDFQVLSSATQGNRSSKITLDADGANSTGSDYLQFSKTGGSNQKIFFPSNDLIFEGSSEHLRIKADGKVGIGETAPLTKLHVKTADSGVTPFANADEMLVEGSTHSGITIGSGTSGTGNIYFGDSADNDVGSITYDHSADRLDFRTNTQSGFFMQTMTGVTITSSYANMLSVPFGGYLIEIGSSANNASREVWLVLRNGAAYSAATTRLLQRTGNDGPRTYNIRVPADGILEAKLDSGSTITDAKISLFKFGM
jgi:hypothetical protein